MGKNLPIKIAPTEPVRRRGRGFPQPKVDVDRATHAVKLREGIASILKEQAAATAARDPALPHVPPGVQVVIEPLRDEKGKLLAGDVEVPRAWGLQVIEERQDGSVIAVRRGEGLDAIAKAVEGWAQNARDAKGRAKQGTRPIGKVGRIVRVRRENRVGEDLLAEDPTLTSEHVVDVEFAAGSLDGDGGPGRRHDLGAWVHASGGELIGRLVAEDYSVFRVRLSGQAIRELVESHPDVEFIDLPPRIERDAQALDDLSAESPKLEMARPPPDATVVGVIDGGVVSAHPLLKVALDGRPHRSWIPGEASIVPVVTEDAQHGTGVASIAALGSLRQTLTASGGRIQPVPVTLARVLGAGGQLPERLHLPAHLHAIFEHLHTQGRTRIVNHSIASHMPFRTSRMSVWAERLDHAAYDGGKPGYLVVVATGNLDGEGSPKPTWLHAQIAEGCFPAYLLDARCRLRDPAQAMNVLTVGGYVPQAAVPWSARVLQGLTEVARSGDVSPFTRTGRGYRGAIKPELVEEAGNLYRDASGAVSSRRGRTDVAVADARYATSGRLVRWDCGTSFAAPRAAHHAARIADALGGASPDMLRAILVNVAEWPVEVPRADREAALRMYGYGVPRIERVLALGGSRVMVVAEDRLAIDKVVFIEIPFPREIFPSVTENRVKVSITLGYRSPVRRSNRRYLGVRMAWGMARRNETADQFRKRFARPEQIDAMDDVTSPDDDLDIPDEWAWHVGFRRRNCGTCQKDWFTAPVAYFDDVIRLAVVARRGWLEGKAMQGHLQRYALSVLIEAEGVDVPLYESIRARVRVPGARVRTSAR